MAQTMNNETPIRSGNEFIDQTFDWCVELLMWGADLFGISYFEINIWVFCVLWPLFTLALIIAVLYQFKKIRTLKKELN